MLFSEEYRELLRYRDAPIPRPAEPPHITLQLLDNGFLMAVHRREVTVEDAMQVERILPYLAITGKGKLALREFEENAEKERNDRAREEAEQEAKRLQTALDRRKSVKRDVIVGIVSSAVGGLIVLAFQNWPDILSALAGAIDKISQVFAGR